MVIGYNARDRCLASQLRSGLCTFWMLPWSSGIGGRRTAKDVPVPAESLEEFFFWFFFFCWIGGSEDGHDILKRERKLNAGKTVSSIKTDRCVW
jgi:hypothetical protein